MIRALLAALAGYAAWTVLWLAGNALLFEEGMRAVSAGEAYGEVGPLAVVLALSVVCSLVGGALAAQLGGSRRRVGVRVLALALLATGIPVQLGVGSLLPLWYHVLFLLLLIPMALAGARLVTGGAASGAT